MAIDTAAKRRSAICTRRLPWFRRFWPAPDGSMTQEDRQQLAFVYVGILATEVVADIPGCLHISDAAVWSVTVADAVMHQVTITDAAVWSVTATDRTC